MISKQISRCAIIASLLEANVALTQPAMADIQAFFSLEVESLTSYF